MMRMPAQHTGCSARIGGKTGGIAAQSRTALSSVHVTVSPPAGFNSADGSQNRLCAIPTRKLKSETFFDGKVEFISTQAGQRIKATIGCLWRVIWPHLK